MSESQNPQGITIPKTPEKWDDLATNYEADLTVHKMEVMNSGSRVTPKQFLSFRVIWPKPKNLRNLGKEGEIINRKHMDEMAETFKENKTFSSFFESYLTAVEKDWGPSEVVGVFQLVRKYQMEVCNRVPTDGSTEPMSSSVRMTPTPTPGPATSSDRSRRSQSPAESLEQQTQTSAAESWSPFESRSEGSVLDETPAAEQEWRIFERTTDEQYVNMALITFLDAVTTNLPNVMCHWGIRRLALKARFDKATMEAHTDGYLYGLKANDEAFAIVETKAHCRTRDGQGSRIYMQESAEMVAWIVRDAGIQREVLLKGNRRLLVSQDRHEIWLTWASYDADYVKYLTDKTFTGRPFLKMNEIGPFNTMKSNHMRRLAQYIGYFCRQNTDTIKKAQVSSSNIGSQS